MSEELSNTVESADDQVPVVSDPESAAAPQVSDQPGDSDAGQDREAPEADVDGAASASGISGSEEAVVDNTDQQTSAENDATKSEPESASAPLSAPGPSTPKEDEPLRQIGMDWYVLRVASNKENQVKIALERKVKIEGMDSLVGRIMVPTIKEKRMKGGQARVYERKLYPGYVFVEMRTEDDGSIPENVWFLVKETTGVGDFIGSDGKPSKMAEHDIVSMLAASQQTEEQPGLSGLNFKKGDVVKVTEGSFENFEGTIDGIDEHRGMVTVLLTIFGRSTPVEVEYWQLEKLS